MWHWLVVFLLAVVFMWGTANIISDNPARLTHAILTMRSLWLVFGGMITAEFAFRLWVWRPNEARYHRLMSGRLAEKFD